MPNLLCVSCIEADFRKSGTVQMYQTTVDKFDRCTHPFRKRIFGFYQHPIARETHSKHRLLFSKGNRD